jgi:hypothetical protein
VAGWSISRSSESVASAACDGLSRLRSEICLFEVDDVRRVIGVARAQTAAARVPTQVIDAAFALERARQSAVLRARTGRARQSEAEREKRGSAKPHAARERQGEGKTYSE